MCIRDSHESSEEYVEAAKHKVQETKTDYFTAVKAAHAALSNSEHPEIEAKMAGEWSNGETFMKEIHPAHAIWRHDEDTAMAKAALTHTRVNLVTAVMQGDLGRDNKYE